MTPRFDSKDLAILELIQKDCKQTAREIATKINSPITTVFAKIKRMEENGTIKGYKAILEPKQLGYGTTAFILASVTYGIRNEKDVFSQRDKAAEIARFPEVQEVHIITGDWDLLIKIRAENVDAIGKFVIDKLRFVKGIEKTLTCMVFETCKETTEVPIKHSPKL